MAESVLSEKSLNFAVRIVKFYKFLSETKNETVISKQILRSGTSIGANIAEAQNAQSKNDFISKFSIALKEADETRYWLRLLEKSEIVTTENIKRLKSDLNEIISMLVSSIKTAKASK